MHKPLYLLGLGFSCLCLSACSSAPPQVANVAVLPYSALLESATADTPTFDDIFQLSASQQAEFLAYFNAPVHQNVAAHRRVYQFLSQHLSGFDYQGKNYTATQAYALKSGNCISLAVLTKALADLAGVEIEFQSIVSAPVLSFERDLMVSSDHVRTFLYDPAAIAEKDKFYFIKPSLVIDYLPSAADITGPRITQQTFVAMFYRNLAADALLAEQYEQALALLKTALQYAPDYSAVINLAAVVHRRMNEMQLAEQFYQYGLDVSASKVTLLTNYAVLKQSQGEQDTAQQMLQSLSSFNEYDPYLWYVLGKNAQQQSQYQEAVTYLYKAAEQAPYMHQLQLELALAYYRNNQPGRALQVLSKAAELVTDNNTQQRYHAKLEALKLRQSAH
ncbi:Flp pilus assembly protein TadD [Rheinheimera pacifica]|uniref:tetratricopeptide repeat protein n=1 Tax=Rheinheimera pacifica TaxID=173990 RepID=UPI0028579203|nr:tetratricopeptide repeat protein [Rheinheimera pacifica]MDR6983264.1 Flp pilus assembly protein TadD [Rheinheimera pacifica]